jgi:SAM-dependent methyltransferase
VRAECHTNLGEYAYPHLYDLENAEFAPQGPFYQALAEQTGGPVLELGCGTGRLTIPLARAGFAITGLDIVPAMLERARQKAGGLPVIATRRWQGGDGQEHVHRAPLALRFSDAHEFTALLRACGFTVVAQYGDYDRGPLTPESTTLVTVCSAMTPR